MRKLFVVLSVLSCFFFLGLTVFAADGYLFVPFRDGVYHGAGLPTSESYRFEVVTEYGTVTYNDKYFRTIDYSYAEGGKAFLYKIPFKIIYEQLGLPNYSPDLDGTDEEFFGFLIYQDGTTSDFVVKTGGYTGYFIECPMAVEIYSITLSDVPAESFSAAVSNVLPLVISWVGILITALVSGSLRPLLVTFCVAVAVVVVFLVVRYIKKY